MNNDNPLPALAYHLESVLSRDRTLGARPDRIQVRSFKLYKDRVPIELPDEIDLGDVQIMKGMRGESAPRKPGLAAFSAALYLACGVTAVRRTRIGDLRFRSAASAGALYPVEVYPVLENMPGLGNGLYNYNPIDHALTKLRSGISFENSTGSGFRLAFVITSVLARSFNKYGIRSYRYCLLDAGHVIENLCLSASALGFPLRVDYDMDDLAADLFLGNDPSKEVSLALCSAQAERPLLGRPLVQGQTTPCGVPEMDRILAVHRAGSRIVKAPLSPSRCWPEQCEIDIPIRPEPVQGNFAKIITRRRSRRDFIPEPLSLKELDSLLGFMLLRDFSLPVEGGWDNSLQTGFAALGVQGLEQGYYVLDREEELYGLARQDEMRERLPRACLGQSWLSRAALVFAFTADIRRIEAVCGPRGYRYALLTAGRMGQRAYLGAEALGLGACGAAAFFDSEAADLLGLENGQVLLHLTAVGRVCK